MALALPASHAAAEVLGMVLGSGLAAIAATHPARHPEWDQLDSGGTPVSFHKIAPPEGSRPGTLAIPPGSLKPAIRVIDYSPDGCSEAEIQDLDDLSAYLERDSVTWVDVRGLGDEDVLWRLSEIFGIHPLAVEDIVNIPQRAKAEVYPDHLLVVARTPIISDGDVVEVPQVCFFVGRGYVLTFQERPFGFFEPVRDRCRAGIGPIWSQGPDYLAYALIDTLVDHYFPIAESLSQRIEDIEDEVVEAPRPDCLPRLHRIRRQLVILRRVGWPQREAIHSMLRDSTPFVSEEIRSYLRDTHDHIAQIMEAVDSGRELAVGLTEIYLSSVSHKTNEIMKVLTLMASIFIPLTFVAGVYGMNFEFMPELHRPEAYPVVLGFMVVLAVALIAYFWHRGWIGNPRRPRSRD